MQVFLVFSMNICMFKLDLFEMNMYSSVLKCF
ncbi:rCG59178 [Rattus norvegicus]|uniref:RCG59178 n=1 Tax=Rattus norvegicus TaxID=10116 RepID=A6KIX9_RAT|nr:rCG59178 [Rattus norvegicus]